MAAYVRSRKSYKQVYDKAITIRCTEYQHEAWTEKSKDMGMTLNQFIRLAANQLTIQDSIQVQHMNIK